MDNLERHLRHAEADLMNARASLARASIPDPFDLEAQEIRATLESLESRVKRLRICGFQG